MYSTSHYRNVATYLLTAHAAMITDTDLYSIAMTLGLMSMALIVGYHYLEVNAVPEPRVEHLTVPLH